jgi:hypothetical protein
MAESKNKPEVKFEFKPLTEKMRKKLREEETPFARMERQNREDEEAQKGKQTPFEVREMQKKKREEAKKRIEDKKEMKAGGKVFKSHMMYDKKTGKAIKAPTMAKHLELKKKGYGHTKPTKMKAGGALKAPTNTGLKKLPTKVRNKMGYMKAGGKVTSKCKRDGIAIRGRTKGRMV